MTVRAATPSCNYCEVQFKINPGHTVSPATKVCESCSSIKHWCDNCFKVHDSLYENHMAALPVNAWEPICNYCEIQAKINPGHVVSPAIRVCESCSSIKHWCNTCFILVHGSLYMNHGRSGSPKGQDPKLSIHTRCSVSFNGDTLVVTPSMDSSNHVEDVIMFLQTGKQLILANSKEIKKSLEAKHGSAILELKSKVSKVYEDADVLLKEHCSQVDQSTADRIAGLDDAMSKLSTYRDGLKTDRSGKAKSEAGYGVQLTSECYGGTFPNIPRIKLSCFAGQSITPHRIPLHSLQSSIAEFLCVGIDFEKVGPAGVSHHVKDCCRKSKYELFVAAGHHGLFYLNGDRRKVSGDGGRLVYDGTSWGLCIFGESVFLTTYEMGSVLECSLRNSHPESYIFTRKFDVQQSKGLSGISAFQDGRLAVADELLQRVTIHRHDGIQLHTIGYPQVKELSFPRFVACQGNEVLYVSCKNHVLKYSSPLFEGQSVSTCQLSLQWSCAVVNANTINVIDGNLFVCQPGRGLTVVDVEAGEIRGQVDLPDIGASEIVSVTEATWHKGKITRMYVNTV